jgi:hypothetical protein
MTKSPPKGPPPNTSFQMHCGLGVQHTNFRRAKHSVYGKQGVDMALFCILTALSIDVLF